MQVFATSPAAVYTGIGNAFTRISSTEGMRALWRGVSSVILGAGPAHAVHFGTYEAVKELVGGNNAGNQWLATCTCLALPSLHPSRIHQRSLTFPRFPALAGASATIASDALMNPFDGELSSLSLLVIFSHPTPSCLQSSNKECRYINLSSVPSSPRCE